MYCNKMHFYFKTILTLLNEPEWLLLYTCILMMTLIKLDPNYKQIATNYTKLQPAKIMANLT